MSTDITSAEIPAVSHDAVADIADADEIIEAGAIEQARYRLRLLQRTFSSTVEVLLDMHRDEDWRHLTDQETGAPYSSFTAMIVAELQMSEAWARRQQQIIQMIMPIKEITHPDAKILVTSADVVALGQSGAAHVHERAPEVLAGLDDPREQEVALRRLIDDTRQTMSGQLPQNSAQDAHSEAEDSTRSIDSAEPTPSSSDIPPWEDGPDLDDGAAADERGGSAGDGLRSVGALGSDAAAAGRGDEQSPTDSEMPPAGRVSIEVEAPADGEATAAADDPREVLAEIAAGGDPYTAAIRLLAAPLPESVTVDVDTETVTSAMLQLTQLRSTLFAAQRPQKGRRRYGAT